MSNLTSQDALLDQYHRLRVRRDAITERADCDIQMHRELDSINDRLDDLIANFKALSGSTPWPKHFS